MIRKLSYRVIVIAMVSALVVVPVACGKKGPLERLAIGTVKSGIKAGVTVESTLAKTIIRRD